MNQSPSPPTSEHSDDVLRAELPWQPREELFLGGIAEKARSLSAKHSAAAILSRQLYSAFGIPGVLLPLIAASLNEWAKVPWVASVIMLVAAALSALNTFMSNGQKSVSHDTASARFAAVDGAIAKCLAVPKAHRVACDVALERFTNMFDSATAAAPPL
jgi:hypothetical protein